MVMKKVSSRQHAFRPKKAALVAWWLACMPCVPNNFLNEIARMITYLNVVLRLSNVCMKET